MARKLLVIDTSYGYEAIRARQLEDSVTCRDLGGYFEHVWSVHPFSSLVSEGRTSTFGKAEYHALGRRHTFVDGKIGRLDALSVAPRLNFLLGQSELALALLSLIRRERIDVIRAGDPLYNGLFGLSLARAAGIPFVIRVNANYDKIAADTGRPMMPRLFGSYRIEKRVIRVVLPQADLVAAPNEDNLRFAVANGARPEHTTVFRYGNLIDKRHLEEPAKRDASWSNLREFWPEPRSFVLYVGRLEHVKCPDHVVRSVAEVRRRGHDVSALLVGDGQMRDGLEELARELGVAEHVVFAGNRGQGWLAQVIPLASAVLSPHTGRALAEVAFGSAPIVAYDLDWQGELIKSGQTGELVPAHEWSKMADGLDRLLRDRPRARRLGEAARALALDMLDPARLDQHERDEYEKLFRRFSRRRRTLRPSA